MNSVFRRVGFLPILFVIGCQTLPCPTPVVCPPCPAVPFPSGSALALLPETKIPFFLDDADTTTLRSAAWNSRQYYQGVDPQQTWRLGSESYSAGDMVASMDRFITLIDQSTSTPQLADAVRRDFNVYQSTGSDAQQTVTFSSYYEPMIEARLQKTEAYRYPLYGRPEDLIEVDLETFDLKYQGAKVFGRREGSALVPYYTREEIDGQKKLRDQNVEIAWAKDPIDVFYLQIEGSGWLDLGGGKRVRIRYDGNNGRKYNSVGVHLLKTGRMTSSQLNHVTMQAYLNAHPEERQALLNVNPRYVFFRIDTSTAGAFAFGNIDQPLTSGRSVATDPKLFPKGGLAWIETQQTVLDAEGRGAGTRPLRRFVLSQDEGGAIQGPGRVDFFVGHGRDAEQFATHFWYPGKLYFLVKKKSRL